VDALIKSSLSKKASRKSPKTPKNTGNFPLGSRFSPDFLGFLAVVVARKPHFPRKSRQTVAVAVAQLRLAFVANESGQLVDNQARRPPG
jgi:hypothetical protein